MMVKKLCSPQTEQAAAVIILICLWQIGLNNEK
jgi:hypothetical protein